ncbi:hypothetical protein Dsin_000798 [Dipteronia sinensis]|uniref:Uncharacterized protein n=1 Tax=Dipteronia sinensis TaxID=43782 RepID=A0AAE0B336_9ROSI|nr:hypothetical protein Dsin_000798 [Dipteronia sinensis]
MSSTGQVSPVVRPTANFHPNIWGDHFLNYNFEKDEILHASQLKEVEKLKIQVRGELLDIAAKHSALSEQLNLIDAIERLGVGYHFETEIEQLLRHVYDSYDHHIIKNDHIDLYIAALCFRLLRQHGHHVSCDIFNKFKDDKGNFKESLKSDMCGMLSLYEAAQLMVHGEDILEEAIDFTTTHLKIMATNNNPLAAQQIPHVLKCPIHKAVPRIETRRYISIYQDNQALLRLAKLDFNLLQALHKKELCELSEWWKNLDFIGRLPFARDRLVEGYFWMLGLYHLPDRHYSISRKVLAKGVVILTFIDDTYDAYGTPEELTLFTEAINRWDMSCMDQLPEYMQIIYKAMLDFYQEVEQELAKKGWSYRVHYGIEAMKMICNAYYEESTWFRDNRTPTYEEYMDVALVSVGYTFTIAEAFMSIMDSMVTKEDLDWALGRPTILKASELMLRLVEDVKSHKFERERGHIPSSVECYMKQYGASQEETYEEFNKQVKSSWKDVNEECLKLGQHLPRPLLMCILNFTRTTHLIYDGDDNFTRVGKQMQAHIASLLVDPVPI